MNDARLDTSWAGFLGHAHSFCIREGERLAQHEIGDSGRLYPECPGQPVSLVESRGGQHLEIAAFTNISTLPALSVRHLYHQTQRPVVLHVAGSYFYRDTFRTEVSLLIREAAVSESQGPDDSARMKWSA